MHLTCLLWALRALPSIISPFRRKTCRCANVAFTTWRSLRHWPWSFRLVWCSATGKNGLSAYSSLHWFYSTVPSSQAPRRTTPIPKYKFRDVYLTSLTFPKWERRIFVLCNHIRRQTLDLQKLRIGATATKWRNWRYHATTLTEVSYRVISYVSSYIALAKGMKPLSRLGFLGDVVPWLKMFAHPLHFQSGVSADKTSCDVSSDSILRIWKRQHPSLWF